MKQIETLNFQIFKFESLWIFDSSYKVHNLMFSKCFLVIVLKVAKSPECKNDVRAHAVVGHLKGPVGHCLLLKICLAAPRANRSVIYSTKLDIYNLLIS